MILVRTNHPFLRVGYHMGCEALGKGGPFWCWPFRSLVDQIFGGEPHPYRASLYDVRVIMMFVRVLMMELLYQAVMGHISALECLSLGTRGSQRLCLILSGIKWHRHPWTPALGDPGVRAESGQKDELDRADRWQDPAHPRPLRWDKMTGICRSQV
jgi:hypothetical protein